jgi:HD-like signal output (HDOD) protein
MRNEQMAAMGAKLARLETIIEMAGLPQSLAQLGTIQASADTETG